MEARNQAEVLQIVAVVHLYVVRLFLFLLVVVHRLFVGGVFVARLWLVEK